VAARRFAVLSFVLFAFGAPVAGMATAAPPPTAIVVPAPPTPPVVDPTVVVEPFADLGAVPCEQQTSFVLGVTPDGGLFFCGGDGTQWPLEFEGEPAYFHDERYPLRLWQVGEQVRFVQSLLVQLGVDVGDSGADGYYGVATYLGVVDWQLSRGRPVTAMVTVEDMEAMRTELGASPAAPVAPVAPAGPDPALAPAVAQGFLAAVAQGDVALASSLELPGREPSTVAWFQNGHTEAAAAARTPVDCFAKGDSMWCLFLPGEPAEYLLVLAPSPDGASWLVSHPLWLPLDDPSPDPARLACVIDTTPLNFRGGPGTKWPNFDAIPVGDCTVMLTDAVVDAAANGKPWRYVGWNGHEGWVSDAMLQPVVGS